MHGARRRDTLDTSEIVVTPLSVYQDIPLVLLMHLTICSKMVYFSIFLCLCLCLCCYVACVSRSCISISTSINMSAVFPSAEKHESRVQSRSKNAKNGG